MTQLERAEALLEIIADELNIKRLILFEQTFDGVPVQVEYKKAGKIEVYRNHEKVNAPKTALMFAERFLESKELA